MLCDVVFLPILENKTGAFITDDFKVVLNVTTTAAAAHEAQRATSMYNPQGSTEGLLGT